MARKGGSRRNTRYLLKKNLSEKGKVSFKEYLQEFKEGDVVSLSPEPAVHEGLYHPRFTGRKGVVKGKQGDCYKVSVKDGGKDKILISHPSHLKKTN